MPGRQWPASVCPLDAVEDLGGGRDGVLGASAQGPDSQSLDEDGGLPGPYGEPVGAVGVGCLGQHVDDPPDLVRDVSVGHASDESIQQREMRGVQGVCGSSHRVLLYVWSEDGS